MSDRYKNKKLYNCAVVISDGSILGIVPKTHLPNYSEFYELRHFTSGEGLEEDLWFGEEFGYVNVAVNQLFKCKEIPELVVSMYSYVRLSIDRCTATYV